jgi:hypothetical protein
MIASDPEALNIGWKPTPISLPSSLNLIAPRLGTGLGGTKSLANCSPLGLTKETNVRRAGPVSW